MKVKANKFVEKPWGSELWIALTDKYCLKKICLNKGERTSLQYHLKKDEHSYILSGKLSIEEQTPDGNIITTIYGAGEIIHNPPLYQHRVSALEDSVFIEVSTPEVDDVIRVADDYNR